VRILARRLAVMPDPGVLVPDAPGPDVVWLDSGLPQGSPDAAADRARWSILAFCDGPFGVSFVHEDRIATCSVPDAARRWFDPAAGSSRRSAFTVLDELLRATPRLEEPIPGCGFALGWVGYLGYELGRESGGPDRVADDHPDAHLRFVDRAVVLDHRLGVSWVLALVDPEEPVASAANRAWAGEMAVRIATERRTGREPADVAPCLQTGTAARGRVSRAVYETAVDGCREEIRHGNAFQVCLTTAFRTVPGAHLAVSGLDTYATLRAVDPVPFGCYLRLGRVEVLGRSPERFLRIDADGVITAEPIKGTRPRGADEVTDRALADELRTSPKDRAENVMIVDLLRNDLLRSAVPGSVHVERLCAVESYAGVHQLVSTVSGVLPDGASRATVVRAAFPPGSMTGAPKISAMAIADRLEGAPRGVYSGVIGYFSASGAVDLAVTIRSLVVVRAPDGTVRSCTLGAGGAVTWSSRAAEEADEVETKARSVLGGVGIAPVW
jgi:anthranilate synthase component 1/para-aminobenzoate synthetase